MVDGVGTNNYAYTAGGELWTEGGVFASDTVTNAYTYRKRGSLALQQPTGAWTNGFGYDGAGRLYNVISPAGTNTYGYQSGLSSALVQSLALPDGSTITNAYDSMVRLTATILRTGGGTALDSAQYGYNAAGQRTNFLNQAGTNILYSYDNIGQLKVASSTVTSDNRGYAYDAAWNLNWLTNNGTVSQFKVDVKNELTNWVDGACYSDANGNLTIKPVDSTGTTNIVFSYDDENRLVAATNTLAGWATVFIYDGLGRMRIRLEYGSNGSGGGGGSSVVSSPGVEPESSGGGTWTLLSETCYLYDGMRVIQERNGSNLPQVSYTRGNDLSGTLQGAGGIGGLLARSYGYSTSSGGWSTHGYYHADGNGNITALEAGGALVAQYYYDPYGNTMGSSGSLASANVYRFSSKEIHVNSGLYYYLYRFYDPSTQRWMNRDAMGEAGGVNLYRFVGNNPVNEEDPFGLTNQPGDFGWQWYSIPLPPHSPLIPPPPPPQIGPSTGQAVPYNANPLPNPATYGDLLTALGQGEEVGSPLGYNAANQSATVITLPLMLPCKARVPMLPAAENTVTRYVGATEARIAQETGFIPNVDRFGQPKVVYVTPEAPVASASQAEGIYQIGRVNPMGATAPPTHVIVGNPQGINFISGGNVAGSTQLGTELLTTERIPIISVRPIGGN